ncbi:hypothetical protein ACFY30_35510 [Streptomyces sp. NPDC000345]|uniref:hypothetical protein n=1 Tax=Streptomyces sp. NPDC000345 TaxID=3364537 RepID=UPI0036B38585
MSARAERRLLRTPGVPVGLGTLLPAGLDTLPISSYVVVHGWVLWGGRLKLRA